MMFAPRAFLALTAWVPAQTKLGVAALFTIPWNGLVATPHPTIPQGFKDLCTEQGSVTSSPQRIEPARRTESNAHNYLKRRVNFRSACLARVGSSDLLPASPQLLGATGHGIKNQLG
jgi:hypothetical protein